MCAGLDIWFQVCLAIDLLYIYRCQDGVIVKEYFSISNQVHFVCFFSNDCRYTACQHMPTEPGDQAYVHITATQHVPHTACPFHVCKHSKGGAPSCQRDGGLARTRSNGTGMATVEVFVEIPKHKFQVWNLPENLGFYKAPT